MSLTSGILEERNVFYKENESILDELNQSSRSFYKNSKQIETDHKNEKAILQQKVDILQMQLQEFEQREMSLKKMNADIMSALTELNKKEDHSLRNKVFEELELANQEKQREKQQQKSKMQALKMKMGTHIEQLKEKLEESENKRKEMELNFEKEKLKHQKELEQEQSKIQEVKKELDAEKRKGKTANQNEKLKKKISQLEEENQNLKKNHETELNKMSSDFEKNLTELREIHNQEKQSLEDRIKKLKEELTKSEKENETFKTSIEEELTTEIASLKEQLAETEANHNQQIENLINERDKAYSRFDEVQKSLKELSNLLVKESKVVNPSYNQAMNFLNKIISMTAEPEIIVHKPVIGEGIEAIDHLPSKVFDHCHTESAVSFLDMDPLAQSLACSIIQEPVIENKRQRNNRYDPQNQSRQSWKDIISKLPIKNSVKPYGFNLETDALQNSTVSYLEIDNQKQNLAATASSKKSQQRKSAQINRTSAAAAKENELLDNSNAGKLTWILKDISQLKENSNDQQSDVEKLIMKHDRSGSTDIDVSQISRGMTIHDVRYDRRQGGEVPTKVRYSNTIEVNGRSRAAESRIIENGAGSMYPFNMSISNKKYSDWKEIFNARKERESVNNSSSRKSFHDGIQDVMHGLSSIKSRLEKQQENFLNVKNESLRERERTSYVKPRSYSNVGVKVDSNRTMDNIAAAVYANQSRNNSLLKLYNNNPLTETSKLNTSMNRNDVTTTEQASFYGLTDTSYIGAGVGERSSYYNADARSYSRSKSPIIVREKINPPKSSYAYPINRHRNSLF